MKKKLLLLLACVFVLVAFTSCGGKDVATVNGDGIKESEFEMVLDSTISMYESYGVTVEGDSLVQVKDMVMDQLISQHLIKQVAKELGIKPSGSESKKYYEEQITASFGDVKTGEARIASMNYNVEYFKDSYYYELCQKNIQDKLVEDVNISDATIKAEYEKDKEKWHTVEASHILIKVDEGSTAEVKAKAKTKAQDIIKKLDAGEDFATLAKEYSEDSSAQNGGSLGKAVSKSTSDFVKEFNDALFVLTKVGEYTKTPVATEFGYHIIKLDGKIDANNYDKIKENIKSSLIEQAKQTKYNEYMESYRSKATIEKLI